MAQPPNAQLRTIAIIFYLSYSILVVYMVGNEFDLTLGA